MARTISHSFTSLTREILFLPLGHKIHIFSPPCNILYLYVSLLHSQFYNGKSLPGAKRRYEFPIFQHLLPSLPHFLLNPLFPVLYPHPNPQTSPYKPYSIILIMCSIFLQRNFMGMERSGFGCSSRHCRCRSNSSGP